MRSPLRIIGLHMLAVLAFLALGAGSLRAQPPTPPITRSVPSATVTVAAGGTIRVEVWAKIDDGWPLHSPRHRIKTTWRACSGRICLRPQTATLEVPLQVTTAK